MHGTGNTITSELAAILAADWREDDSARLSGLLYDRCYNHSFLDPRRPGTGAGQDLLPALIAANQSRPTWDEGWHVDQPLEDGRVLARKGGAARAFLPGEYITDRGPDHGPDAGGAINVFNAPGTAELQTWFYFAFGETVDELGSGTASLRVYWNIAPEGAAPLMEALTRELNRFQVPFRFKCLRHAERYTRRDPAILYVSRRYYPIVAMLMEKIYPQMRQWLRESVPLFTRPSAPGLGMAEDPGESFGQHRSKILAEAIIASRGKSTSERLEELGRQFARRGLSLETPWLNAGSANIYEYPFPTA